MADQNDAAQNKDIDEGSTAQTGDSKAAEEAAAGKGELVDAQRQSILDTRQRASISEATSFTSQILGRPEGLEDMGVKAVARISTAGQEVAHKAERGGESSESLEEIRKDPEKHAKRIEHLAKLAGDGDKEARDLFVKEMRYLLQQPQAFQDRALKQMEKDGGDLSSNQDCPYIKVHRNADGQVMRIDFDRLMGKNMTIVVREPATPPAILNTGPDRDQIILDIVTGHPSGR